MNTTLDINQLDFDKMNGLIPAIIQDATDSRVLMLGFMNPEALERTIQTGKVTFWSRTKKRLWQKGETSGNFLEVISITPDCDQDTLLIKVKPHGPTCHQGTDSCFGDECGSFSLQFLQTLFDLIEDRRKQLPVNSYATKLFKQGLPLILEKIAEESEEVALAASHESRDRLISESADLIYHLLVLLADKEIKLMDVITELRSRHVSLSDNGK